MHPGLSDSACWLATLRYRDLVATGQREQFLARAYAPPARPQAQPVAIRRWLGTLLVRAGQRLTGTLGVSNETLIATPPAVAS